MRQSQRQVLAVFSVKNLRAFQFHNDFFNPFAADSLPALFPNEVLNLLKSFGALAAKHRCENSYSPIKNRFSQSCL